MAKVLSGAFLATFLLTAVCGKETKFTLEDAERLLQSQAILIQDMNKQQQSLITTINRQQQTLDTLMDQMSDSKNSKDPGNEEKKRLVLNGEIDLERAVVKLEQEIKSLQTSSGSGAVYTRWGRKSCPGNGTHLVYEGYAGGTYYTSRGGGSNYLCLPSDPLFGYYVSGHQSGADVYGAEYQQGTGYTASQISHFFGATSMDDDVPCAVCRSDRPSSVMIPARNVCYPGWSKEYSGYLVGEASGYDSSEFICMDGAPEAVPGGRGNKNGALFYVAEANCGSLSCPPYKDGQELTCVVCSK